MTAQQQLIYLDYAAATPLDPAVLAAMEPYFSRQFFNPSATYQPALTVRHDLEQARARVSGWLGARKSEISFTAGGSEANNLAIHGLMRRFPEGNVVVSAVEHESVLAAAHHYDCREVAVTVDGTVDLKDLAAKIDDRTVLVSIMYANNEVGTIQPLKRIAEIVRTSNAERRTRHQESRSKSQESRTGAGQPTTDDTLPLFLHTDACQAANYLDLHVARLGVDLMTLNGGKIYGPKQSGALYVKGDITLQPLVDGGGQEHGLRSGTENVAGTIGFAAALDLAQTMRHEETERLRKLQKKFLNMLSDVIPTGVINGARKHRLPNNVHLTLPGRDNERLLIQLEAAGILAAAGSACSASDEEPSHVLRALGLEDAVARASLRFSLGRQTTEAEVSRTVQALAGLLQP